MLKVARRIERAAQADSPVLIWGEKGVGKKLVAGMIHRRSRRGDSPLVIVSTQRSSGQSAEDKLFGAAGQPGRLATVAGGTLLIDEITGLAPTGQARLLAAVEGRRVAKAGNSAGQPIDFRLMATTRHELTASVERGAVREDLYYRLSVVTIRVPPLRERKEDIPCLVRQMLGELCAAHGKRVPAVDPELMARLLEGSWPGNGCEVRDCLKEMLQREDAEVLEMDHLRASFSGNGKGSTDSLSTERIKTLADLERAAVRRALEVHQGNRTQAARALGISVRTLQRKLRHWDV